MYRRRRSRLPTRERLASRILYGASAVNGTDQASYSFASLAVTSPPDNHRNLYAWIFSSIANTTPSQTEPTSCTIGGVPGALVSQFSRVVATSSCCVALFVARVPGGAAATVDAAFGFTVRRCGCILASAIDPILMPRLCGLLTAIGTGDIANPVLVPRTGFVAVHSQDALNGTNAFAFTGAGAVEAVDVAVEGGTRMGAATLGFSDSLSIVSGNDSGIDAIWIGW